jgi:hypothetical protein
MLRGRETEDSTQTWKVAANFFNGQTQQVCRAIDIS